MGDFERTRVNLATAAFDSRPPVASRDLAIALVDEGNTLEGQGRVAEAMARYDAAVQADAQCARAHMNRGNILLAGTEFDGARNAYQLAIACDPNYAGAYFNLGNLNVRAGEFESALRNYQVAVHIKPDFADAFIAMANTLDSLGRTAESVESYERALALIRRDSLRAGDDSFVAQKVPGSSAVGSADARSYAAVDVQSSLLQLRRANKVYDRRLTDPRSPHNRDHRTLGNTIRALPAGTQSNHAQPEDCRLRTPGERIVARTIAKGRVIRCRWPGRSRSGTLAPCIA
jgi:tetratricopeptide (TPR) repeat protein